MSRLVLNAGVDAFGADESVAYPTLSIDVTRQT